MSLKELLFRKHDERIRQHERDRFRAYIRGEVFGGCMEPDRDCHWCEYMSLSYDIEDFMLCKAKAEAWDEGHNTPHLPEFKGHQFTAVNPYRQGETE